jgi:hypothetical protein
MKIKIVKALNRNFDKHLKKCTWMHHLTLIQSLDLLFTFPCWKPPILCQPAMPNHGTSSFCMMEAVAATFSCAWPYLNP